ncbi:hypothetical protein DYU11_06030 [Fibrisoma montanum]|uniref:Uncharacterized protein n=1 Tax=Fibrisoma montanum TaxID=2305895 RepID=A0A418MDL0_9BACT|nr:hypothetical protein [Fibrisoma montanum]RIV24874.1 hypothetical protein DYU11_06030 [Fibrisoma montanum]
MTKKGLVESEGKKFGRRMQMGGGKGGRGGGREEGRKGRKGRKGGREEGEEGRKGGREEGEERRKGRLCSYLLSSLLPFLLSSVFSLFSLSSFFRNLEA